ncbi:hypothetical protein ABIA58_004487 [Pseudomonas frederiksbergensis]|jgi:hypothetical protein
MDYPKSVPSAGLVNGKFVDENPLTGTPGSLIPADWGNGVTEEILNVIKSASLVPSESEHTQLTEAISKKITDELPGQASEIVSGLVKVASQDQVSSGIDDAAAVSSKKLRAGFTLFISATSGLGYIAFPFWLGSFIIQWGTITNSAADVITTLPVSFDTRFLGLVVSSGYTASSGSIGYVAGSPRNLSSFTSRASNSSLGAHFIAVGK